MLSDRFGADHFVQVVLHDGVAQSGRNVCLWNAFGSGRSNGSFNEYRTALAQCGRALCGQRQLAKFSQRDTHTGGLFLYKRTGARCADLVHLEIHDLTVFQADVFAVLPADLKDSIHLRHPVRSALCLRGDLIPHGIGTDALADTLDSRNASGSLERDTDVASLGRLTDFIHVAEGWEEAVAHALDQYASAIVVPAAATCCTPSNALGKISSAKPWC